MFYGDTCGELGITLCRSSHLVSSALGVKNKAGQTICDIMSLSSLQHVFQYAFVPRRHEPKCINHSANLVSGNSLSSLRKS